MKTFEQLSEAELVALDEDAIDRYIDYACAENGVPLLPSVLPAPPVVEFLPDARLYSVGHWLHFTDVDDAKRVLEAINATRSRVETDYLSTPSNVTSTGISRRRVSPVSMDGAEVFSADRAAELKIELEGAKRAQEAYEASQEAYDRAVLERAAWASEIHERIEKAHERERRRRELRAAHERYLSLAGGDAVIATRFLDNSYHDARELLPELFPPPPEPEGVDFAEAEAVASA